MSWRIALQGPLEASSEPPSAAGLQVHYRADNVGDGPSPGHWDHLAIVDSVGMVRYEDWHWQAFLAAGESYRVTIDVGVRFESGSYLVRLNLGCGDAPTLVSVPLLVRSEGGGRQPGPTLIYRFEGSFQ